MNCSGNDGWVTGVSGWEVNWKMWTGVWGYVTWNIDWTDTHKTRTGQDRNMALFLPLKPPWSFS